MAYEKSLDFLTAKDKCQKYVELYPTDEKGQRELTFLNYEKSLDFLTAKDKCQKYVELYPTDEKGQRELTFLNSRN